MFTFLEVQTKIQQTKQTNPYYLILNLYKVVFSKNQIMQMEKVNTVGDYLYP